MNEIVSIPFRLRFVGKDADKHQAEAHAATTTLHGFTRAIQLVSYAYLNMEPVTRATALRGADVYFMTAKPGSMLFDFRLSVRRKMNGVTLNPSIFYDVVSSVLSRAVGKDRPPETSYVRKMDAETDILDAAAVTIEEALKEGHRVIGRTSDQIVFERPRAPLVYFDAETKRYIEESNTSNVAHRLEGHVTRFNTKTGNGRAYINQYNSIIPFSLRQEYPEANKKFITWSLHGSNIHRAKNLTFDLLTVTSSNGAIKRLLFSDSAQTGNDAP